MRECPVCRREWADGHEVCPKCLAALVEDAEATLTCSQCGRACPTRMQACPACFALLRAEDVDLVSAWSRAVAAGRPMRRPPGRRPFAEGLGALVVERSSGSGPLLLIGGDGFVEAVVRSPGPGRWLPLVCEADDEELFRLVPYQAAPEALVAIGPDGAAIGTFLRDGGVLDLRLLVRDETSAPVATLQRSVEGADYELVETGGGRVGTADREAVGSDTWSDDAWTFFPEARLPLRPLAFVAMAVAAKVLLGRPQPVRTPERGRFPPSDQGIDRGIGPDLRIND